MIRELDYLELELTNIYPQHICVNVFRQNVSAQRHLSGIWRSALYRSIEMAEEFQGETGSVKCT